MPKDSRILLDKALRVTLAECDTDGGDLSGKLSDALMRLAHDQGGVESLVRHRPGSWEATHVVRLAGGWRYDF